MAPMARVMNDAGRASRTTPSPMTMPSCTVPPVGCGALGTRRHSCAADYRRGHRRLHRRARRRVGPPQGALVRRRLDGAESDELVRLYQSVATHLSTVRSAAPDPALVTRLSDVLDRARTAIAGHARARLAQVVRFAMVSLPAAFYGSGGRSHAVTAACLLVAVVAASTSPGHRRDELDDDAVRAGGLRRTRAFASYYEPASGLPPWWDQQRVDSPPGDAGGITGFFTLNVLGRTRSRSAPPRHDGRHDELDLFLTLIARTASSS